MTWALAFLGDFGDAIEFIFEGRTSPEGLDQGGTQFAELTWEHVKLSLAATGVACAAAIPLGLVLGHTGRGAFLAISVSNIGRAVPSLALIAFFVAYLSVGFTNVMLALALLAVPPILTNTYVGVRQVDRDTVDAARGMGMTGAEIVRKVELPLSLPLIFGGVKTSMVNVVATATIAPLAGVDSLGDPIINASVYGDAGRLGAAIVVAALAVATELSLSGAQRAVTPRGLKLGGRSFRFRAMRYARITSTALAVFVLGVGLAACGDDDDDESGGGGEQTTATQIQSNPDNAGTTLTVGSKNFTEQKILGEIFAQGFEAAGYRVRKELNLGDEKTALAALEEGEISAYPEYTGTALLSFFDVPSDELPTDPEQAFEQVREQFAGRNITAFPPTPFTSSNEVAITKETQERLGGITKISELADQAGELTLYGSPECRQRRDCLLGLQEVYGLDFRRFVPVAIDLRHEVLEQGRADVSIVFTTDPQIQRNDEVLLEDDKGMFPPYNSTLLVRDDVVEQAGEDLPRVIEQLEAGLTDEVMQELNARVDLDKKTPEQVATEYLRESGLIG